MAESMKDYEKELEESMKTIEEGDILTGTVISVDEKEVILDLKYYAEGVIPAENYSREPGFSLKDEVHEGDVCVIEPGQSHSMENNTDEDFEMMALIYNEAAK